MHGLQQLQRIGALNARAGEELGVRLGVVEGRTEVVEAPAPGAQLLHGCDALTQRLRPLTRDPSGLPVRVKNHARSGSMARARPARPRPAACTRAHQVLHRIGDPLRRRYGFPETALQQPQQARGLKHGVIAGGQDEAVGVDVRTAWRSRLDSFACP